MTKGGPPPRGAEAGALIAFGLSQVDGDGIETDSGARLGDQLARRLRTAGRPTAVLNYGLIGNRLLQGAPQDARNPVGPALGESMLARLPRVLNDAHGARALLLCTSLNDLGLAGVWAPAQDLPTARALLDAYRLLAAMARARQLPVFIANLTPFEQADIAPGYWSPHKDALRREFNRLLRQQARDFDTALRDPRQPARLLPRFDSGDHIHPNAAGYAALAAAVPLDLLG
jgi:lysophospholipase L1-like esterase